MQPSDLDLLNDFEQNILDPDLMTHVNHLRLAWLYLKRQPLPEAIAAFRDGLKRFTIRLGVPGKYHETITFALMLLCAARLGDETESFEDFLTRERVLADDWKGCLKQLYPNQEWDCELARRQWVLPALFCENPQPTAS